MTGGRILFGGDYNPEQWPREVWDDDIALMQAAGVNTATVGVFSWSQLEPRPGEFDFAWLDEVMDLLHAGGIGVVLATATASPPAWLAWQHPDSLPVDENGVRLGFGSRQQYSPSSSAYREHAARLVGRIAERYAAHPALRLWHIGNEYGGHIARSYDAESAEAFRRWLRERYGTIDALNAAWGTAFWSQRYEDFAEIDVPRRAPAIRNPTQLLDFDRFSSDALLELFLAEKAIIREHSALPVTTNFMGLFKDVDSWSWAAHLDIVSDDLYPDPADPRSYVLAAATRDAMRSFGGGRPWLLMEQATSAVNWRPRNVPKPPGLNRVHALQCIARGADGVLHFQWRQSVAGAEKFHSAMLPHAGPDSRIHREVSALGAELVGYGDLVGAPVPSQVAIVWDWDSWRAVEQSAVPALADYHATLLEWYAGFLRRGVAVDLVAPEAALDAYRLVVAPLAHVMTDAAARGLSAVPRRGGVLAVGCRSGVLDENLHARLGGYAGGPVLRGVLGVRVEEFAPLAGADDPAPLSHLPPGKGWQELVVADDAEVVAAFADGFAEGRPAVCHRERAWYVATEPTTALLDDLVARWLAQAGIAAAFAEPLDGVETVVRGDRRFVANHTAHARTVVVDGEPVALAPFGAVLRPLGARDAEAETAPAGAAS